MSKGNWVRIRHDDKKSGNDPQDGFLYSCKAEHDWFLTFPEIEKLVELDLENNCPKCADAE